jgi:hypothetical protein
VGVLLEEGPGVVFASVIDQHNFNRKSVFRDELLEAASKLWKHLLLVVAGDNQRHALRGSVSRCPYGVLGRSVAHINP